MPNPVTDVLWWVNAEVDKLSGVALSRVSEVLDEAQSELANDLARAEWLRTDDRYTAQVHRNALMQVKGAMNHINGKLAPDMAEALRMGGAAAGSLATRHLIETVQKFSSIFEGTVRPIALETASVIARGEKLQWPRFETSAARYAGNIGQDIRRQLAVGMIKGETIDQLTTRLAKQGGPKGLVFTKGMAGDPNARAEIISEGLFKRYRYWGERLARTEVVSAYNETALIGMDDLEDDDPGYFKRWDAAVDGRLCVLCRMFDDLVVPLHATFPHGFRQPPRHPNCRCAVVIWRKEWNEVDVRDNIMADVTPGKRSGTVASVPHKFDLPKPKLKRDDSDLAKRGRKPAGIPESAPFNFKPAVTRDDSDLARRGRRPAGIPESAPFNLPAPKPKAPKIAKVKKAPTEAQIAAKQAKLDKKVEAKKAKETKNLEEKKTIAEKKKNLLHMVNTPNYLTAKDLQEMLVDPDFTYWQMPKSKYEALIKKGIAKKEKEEVLKAKKAAADQKKYELENVKKQLHDTVKDQAKLLLTKPGDLWIWTELDFQMVADNAKIPVASLKKLLRKEVKFQQKAAKDTAKAIKLAEKSRASALLSPSGKRVPKEQLFVLPPPPPSRYTPEERASYKRQAMSEIAESRVEWRYYANNNSWTDDQVKPGMTYSQREFVKTRKKFTDKLTPEEFDACMYYGHKGDQVLNSSIRERLLAGEPDVQTMAMRLDSAIAKHTMTEDTYVGRGMRGPWAQEFASRIQPGDAFQEDGYSSTAATVPFSGPVQMRIRVPKGYPAGPIPTRYPNEDEYLLPRETQYRVLSKEKRGETWYMELEVLQ